MGALRLNTSGFADDFEKNIAKAAPPEETRSQKNGGSKAREANAVNKILGAAAVDAAFAGGLLTFLGRDRAKHAPSTAVAGHVTVSKQLSW